MIPSTLPSTLRALATSSALALLLAFPALAQSDADAPATNGAVTAGNAATNGTTGADTSSDATADTADAASGDATSDGANVTTMTVPVVTAPSAAEEGMSDEARARADTEGRARLERRAGDPIEEAVTALAKTEEAIAALAEGRTDEAIDMIADATGELQVLIARRPVLALAPAATSIEELDVLASPAAIRLQRERIEDLVDDGFIQEARALMRDFGSELILRTTNLPLATYPEALTIAAAEIEAGRPDAALDLLLRTLSTTVITEEVIPLPTLRAEAIMAEAEALAGTQTAADGTDERSEEAIAAHADAIEVLLDAARDQIEMARAFGYLQRREAGAILDQIEEIEDEAVPNAAERLFQNVRVKLAGLFD